MLFLSQNREFTDYIIYLNTQKQLFEQGINANGIKLSDVGGEYSPYTLQLHPEKVKDRITLKDTGEFYASFLVYLDSNSDFVVSADTIKDTSDLAVEWGKEILGLNEESLKLLRTKAIDILQTYVRTVLRND